MRVFVTGATGFVMGAVTRALRARGDAVTALVRNPSRAASVSELGCELVAGDVVDPTDAIGELRRCDALIHGAAIYEIGVSPERRRKMEETNVTGTRRMLEAARLAGTSRIVYVSTIAAFGNTRGAVVAEGHRPTSPPTSAYEDTKRRAHEIALDAARSGAPIVIVQPGQVYGPGDHSAVGANFRALAEGRLRYRAFEDLGLNLVHVDDLADARHRSGPGRRVLRPRRGDRDARGRVSRCGESDWTGVTAARHSLRFLAPRGPTRSEHARSHLIRGRRHLLGHRRESAC